MISNGALKFKEELDPDAQLKHARNRVKDFKREIIVDIALGAGLISGPIKDYKQVNIKNAKEEVMRFLASLLTVNDQMVR
jgi:hypothetical protein